MMHSISKSCGMKWIKVDSFLFKKFFFHFGNMLTLRERPIKQNQTEKGC